MFFHIQHQLNRLVDVGVCLRLHFTIYTLTRLRACCSSEHLSNSAAAFSPVSGEFSGSGYFSGQIWVTLSSGKQTLEGNSTEWTVSCHVTLYCGKLHHTYPASVHSLTIYTKHGRCYAQYLNTYMMYTAVPPMGQTCFLLSLFNGKDVGVYLLFGAKSCTELFCIHTDNAVWFDHWPASCLHMTKLQQYNGPLTSPSGVPNSSATYFHQHV